MIRRTAPAGKLQFLEYHNARAFADYESVASRIPGTAGLLGIVVPGGKRAHGGESAHSHRSDRSFGAAGNHYIGIATRDDLESIADGVGAGSASRAGGLVRPSRVIADADVPRRQVDDRRRNKKWRDFARPAVQQADVLALNYVESANSRSDVYSHPLGNLRCYIQAGSLHRLIRRRQGQVDEAAHLFQFFFLDELQRIEVLYFSGDLAGKLGSVELGDAGDAALPGE